MTAKYALDPDLDAVARTAMAVVSDMRDADPRLTHTTLTTMCDTEPARMAQVLMCLGVWVDPDATTGTLISLALDAAGPRAAA